MKRKSKDKIIFAVISYTLIALFALACVIPFYLIIVGSFTSEHSILTEGYSFLVTADRFSLAGYDTALKNPMEILRAYGVTIFVTVLGTVLSIFLMTMTGYVLSRKDFPWKNGFSFFFFFTTACKSPRHYHYCGN